MKILLTGGGTAGHIYPLIAIAKEIKKLDSKKEFQFIYLGPKDGFASDELQKQGIEIKNVMAGKVRRYFSLMNITDVLFKVPIGIIQAFTYMYFNPPDVVLSKGGYGSLPAVISAKLLMVPIFSHESDSVSGMANRIAERFSLEVFISFPLKKESRNIPVEKAIAVGNPIREEILYGSAEKAKGIFNLTGEKPVILILGGSQGARSINQKILAVLSELLQDFEIIHQTGQLNFHQVETQAGVVVREDLKEYYHVFPFLSVEDLACAYKSADLVISRAGAGSIFEIAANKKPSILIPLANSAQNHQLKNALAYKEAGAAEVMEEPEFTPRSIMEKIKFLISEKSELNEMAQNAASFAKPEAGKIIAEYMVAFLSQNKK